MADYNFGGFRRGALSDVLGPSTTDRIDRMATEIKKRPKQRDTIKTSAKPRGALTAAVSDLVRRGSLALGSTERDAVQRAHAFEDANLEWNPLAQADEVGTQARRYVDGDTDFSPDALAHGAVGTALALAPEAGAPILRALSKTKLGGKVRGALSGTQAPLAIDDAIEGTATTISSVPRQRSGPVRTKDGAIPLGGDADPVGLPTPPTEMQAVQHFSKKPDLSVIDPALLGTNTNARGGRFTSAQEIQSAPQGGKAYFGVNSGKPGGYKWRPGFARYDGEIPKHRIFDYEEGSERTQALKNQAKAVLSGPKSEELKKAFGLPQAPSAALVMDTLAKNAGYQAVRFSDDFSGMGEVIHSYAPVPVERAQKPLAGQPTRIKGYGFMGPYDPAREAAETYTQAAGIDHQPASEYLRVDPDRGAAIAQAYEQMAHAPEDPAVRSAYAKLAEETLAQYEAAKKSGVKFEFNPQGKEVYTKGPWDAVQDVRDNKHMYVYPTDEGYGTGAAITDEDIANNPLLQVVEGERWNGRPVRVNDVFRGVHDYFGHVKDGFGFRHDGEENAWRSHLGMYSPEAQRAMTTETRGQNSWLNFGPHGEANRTASTEDTVFAPQKIGLLPDWVLDPTGTPPQ